MCGIAGLVASAPVPPSGRGGTAPPDVPPPLWKDVVARLCARLAHRGPDGSGLVEPAPGVFLGHRRLSIIDPAGTAQPLANEDGTVWVIYNGEIYNYRELRRELAPRHRLREAGDTEVLVHLWEEKGERMTEPLVGMFAFALYDARDGTLFLARDRFGQKPLYYLDAPGVFAFASEIHALWELPGFPFERHDRVAVSQYFRYGYVPGPRTVYEAVRALPPGHVAIRRAGRLRVSEYWRPRVVGQPWPGGLGEIEVALEDAVRLQLRSDVPLGAFLSGGVDSALVVSSMARQLERPVETFTISTGPGPQDESADARATARRLGTKHHEFRVEPDLVPVAEELAAHYGQPFADYSCVPTHWVSRETVRHVKVALTGDGGDELFAGYERYTNARWAGILGRMPVALRRGLAGILAATPLAGGQGGRLRDFVWSAGPIEHKGENASALFHGRWREKAFRPELLATLADGEAARTEAFRRRYAEAASDRPLERWLETDQAMSLADDMLVKVDVASMACSLECRSPFLDHRFAEAANRLPLEAKLRGSGRKLALRELARRRVGSHIARLPKRGFSLPLAGWLRGRLREYAWQAIFAGSRSWEPYLAERALRKLWSEHQAGRADHAMRLWTVVAWEHWHQAEARRRREVGGAP